MIIADGVHLVAKARGVKEGKVKQGIATIYQVLSRYAHGNDGCIVLKALVHPDNERAGLVAIMEMQGRWLHPLAWREEKEDRQALSPHKKNG